MAALNEQTRTQEVSTVEPGRDRARSAWDEPRPAGTNGIDHGTSGAGWMIHAIAAAAVFATTLVNALSAAYDAARRGGVYDPRLPLLWELSSAVVIVALLPLVDFAIRTIRHERSWFAKALWAGGTVVAFSSLHIGGMVALRKLVMGAFGSSYSFSFAPPELLYEFRKDAVACFLLGTVFWLAQNHRAQRAKPAVAEALPAPALPTALWLRDGATRIRIEPEDVVQVTSAGNYIEYCMADGRTHLIRGTLAAEETRLAAFNIVRVHRTRLVSLTRVSALQPGPNGDFELMLDTGQTVSGSRRYRSAVVSVVEGASAPAPSTNSNQLSP